MSASRDYSCPFAPIGSSTGLSLSVIFFCSPSLLSALSLSHFLSLLSFPSSLSSLHLVSLLRLLSISPFSILSLSLLSISLFSIFSLFPIFSSLSLLHLVSRSLSKFSELLLALCPVGVPEWLLLSPWATNNSQPKKIQIAALLSRVLSASESQRREIKRESESRERKWKKRGESSSLGEGT